MAKTVKTKIPAGAKPSDADLSHIAPDLWPLVVPIDSLTPDPRNARTHGEQNLTAIARSLTDNGQLKAVSVDAAGTILAGNGTHAAAVSLGWKYIARVRCNLTGAAARRWAIQDNRSAELAEWDQAELQNQIEQITADLADFDVSSIGFTDDQLDALSKGDFEEAHGFAPKPAKVEKSPDQEIDPQFKIIITCRDEAHQADLIEKFTKLKLDFTAPSM